MLAVLTGLTLLVGVGCTKQIQGSAQPDPNAPLTQVSDDGYGLIAGFPEAPVQIEIFAEPQCSHCADLQRDVGDDLRHYIGLGQLAVTYRPMTFLETADYHYSERVSNALFVAASEGNSPAVDFQSFVEDLWADQDPSGRGPSDDEMAEKARAAGLPDDVAQRIADGEGAVDAVEMDAANYDLLYLVDPVNTGTPTVYDLTNDEVVDIYDDDWLDKLMSSA
ncbi:DsbA family protein [Mycolicibacterium bacteremicum]|uniref:Protein-disulfide isomerase n=1 Tax=Mycolicibacterium bacteremicum TaxID=564198 RepID=A0A1W9Z2X2_MYCBA|nr:thioredoxin domain-containing protein [Mycolicibacterium bacteremicum]MCV7431972.1 thioredoxin domain-containing protein [Mycolicibacterium bacteremicum]ORA06587.1 protein-disulfide isomerase [Mycolicibacterium bacteremicum]